MTMREQIIEAMARAIFFRGGEQDDHFWTHTQSHHRDLAREQAAFAFDAALGVMKGVENETLRAGYEAMFVSEWDGTQAAMMGAGWDAMLATLEADRASD